MKLDQVLKEFGLSLREAKVYLANLELGQASIQEIAKKAGIERTGTYYVVEAMKREGLISEIEKDGRVYLAAAAPEQILNLAKRKKEIIEEHLPEFKAIYNISDKKPKVRLYEGLEGIKTIFEKTLMEKEILAFTSFSVGHDYSGEWGHDYVRRRAQKGIFARDIAEDSPESREHKTHDKEECREMRIVPRDKFPFTNEINILSDWVMIVSWKDMIGLAVESKDIAAMWRSVFELAWLGAQHFERSEKD